jgi:hypothetical protein
VAGHKSLMQYGLAAPIGAELGAESVNPSPRPMRQSPRLPVAVWPSPGHPNRLGSFPFWRGGERFLDALESVYRQASQQGLAAFLGERVP